MADVFISYARQDRKHAERLARALEREGLSVWWDIEALRSGQSFNRAIQQALEQAVCVVVLWSASACKSRYVEAEAYWAWEHQKLHSVRLDDSVRVPVPFNTVQARSLAGWRAEPEFAEFGRLVADLRGDPRDAPTPRADPAQTAEAGGSGGGGRSPWWAAVFAGALGIAALVMILMRTDPRSPAPSADVPLPEMVTIPAGTFRMGCVSGRDCQGDERPVHTVTFAKPFGIGKHEVTFAEYDRFAEAAGRRKPDDEGWGRGSRPVINVSWSDARDYAKWLSGQTVASYRLPTEAEWEYATRAGTATLWSFGDGVSELGTYAWNRENSNRQTHPVGGKEPNPIGLHDVHGNVWERVAILRRDVLCTISAQRS